jgi:hypothetical protein
LIPYKYGTPAYRLKSKTRNTTYYHVLYSSGSYLPAREGSGAAACPIILDPSSLLGRASALPHAHGSISRLPTREGSGAEMCPMALDHTSLLRRASVLPCFPRLSAGRGNQE